jgi:predicted RNA-binding Zn-ribbon protein involved in translation (DUF1610 family)
MKTISYLGQIDTLFGVPATTRNWNTNNRDRADFERPGEETPLTIRHQKPSGSLRGEPMAKKVARKAPFQCPECGNSQDFWVTLNIKQSGQTKIIGTIHDYTGMICDKCEFKGPAKAFMGRDLKGAISLKWTDKV